MPRTWQSIVDDVRDLLQDQQTPFRYQTGRIVARINHALEEVGRIRPEAYYNAFEDDDIQVPRIVEQNPDPDQLALSDEFTLSGQLYTPIVLYVSGSCELVDDEFVSDGRAMMLLNQFRSNLLQL